jgi:hypothetical protein
LAPIGCSLVNPWLALTFKTMQLGLEAQNVIALRMMRFAAGGASGQSEARRMVTEKIATGAEVQATAVSGAMRGQSDAVIAGEIVRVLQKRVRANRRRLSR